MHTRWALIGGLVTALVALGPGAAPAQGTAADHHLRLAQQALRRRPGDARALLRLGDAALRKWRQTGDAAWLARAEHALTRAVALAPDLAGARRHLAHVFYLRHEFDRAADEAQRAVALDPADGDAWGVLGDARLEVGRYDEAEAAYARMLRTRDDLHALARRAGLRSLRGDVRGALDDLARAIDEGRAAGRPAESIAWVQWQKAAEHLAVGEVAAAEAEYAAALATQPDYYRALAGLAQVRAAQGRLEAAAALCRQALAIVPLPEYAVLLGDVQARAGRPEEARRAYDLVEYIGRLDAVNRVMHNRELVLFWADQGVHLDQAVALARGELEGRRDVYGWDALAWALHRSGRSSEALPAMAEALRLGTRDARLHFHAGMIHHALGDAGRARDHLARALAINPRFHVRHAETAAAVLRGLEAARGPGGGAALPAPVPGDEGHDVGA
jgi:tetratricopeptide (TPR) repeat protein